MPPIVKQYHEHMEDHGADHRIERRALVESDGQFHWVVYNRTKTGAGEGKPGKHPVIKGEDGKPIETHETHVWVPVFAGPEKAARMRLTSLVGA